MHVHTDTQVACVFVYWKRKTENCCKGKKKVNLTVGAPGCIQYHQPGFGSMACGQGVNLIQIQLHHTATAKQILISRVLLLLRWACMLGGVISIAYRVKILWRIAMILIHMMQLLTWLLLLVMAMDMMGSRTWVVVAIMLMIMVRSMSSMRAWVMRVTWLTVIIRKQKSFILIVMMCQVMVVMLLLLIRMSVMIMSCIIIVIWIVIQVVIIIRSFFWWIWVSILIKVPHWHLSPPPSSSSSSSSHHLQDNVASWSSERCLNLMTITTEYNTPHHSRTLLDVAGLWIWKCIRICQIGISLALSLSLSHTHTHTHPLWPLEVLNCIAPLHSSLPHPPHKTSTYHLSAALFRSDGWSSSRYRPFVIRVPVIKQVPMIKLLRSYHVLLDPIRWRKHCSW